MITMYMRLQIVFSFLLSYSQDPDALEPSTSSATVPRRSRAVTDPKAHLILGPSASVSTGDPERHSSGDQQPRKLVASCTCIIDKVMISLFLSYFSCFFHSSSQLYSRDNLSRTQSVSL